MDWHHRAKFVAIGEFQSVSRFNNGVHLEIKINKYVTLSVLTLTSS
jgi:hypothetical protein